METKVSRIFVFPSGARIDLKKIICIGALDKDQFYNVFIPVYCAGCNKPLHFNVANTIGKVSQEQKDKVNVLYNDFINEWEQFIIQENG